MNLKFRIKTHYQQVSFKENTHKEMLFMGQQNEIASYYTLGPDSV